MLFFPRKSLFNCRFSWLIISITIFVHLLLLIQLFFFYASTNEYFTIFIHQTTSSNLDITLLSSLVKTNQNKLPASSLVNNKQKVTKNNAIKINKQPPSPKKQDSKEKNKKIESTPLPADTKLLSASLKSNINQKKIVQEKKSPIKKNNIALKEKPKPKDEKKMSPPKDELTKNKKEDVSKNIIAQKKSDTIDTVSTQIVSDKVIEEECISLSLEELELLKKVNYLQTELARVWHPPIIQKINPTCTLEFFVNWQGIIESIKIVESSGVLLFDSAARKALYTMHIPEWAKGKSITIVLKA